MRGPGGALRSQRDRSLEPDPWPPDGRGMRGPGGAHLGGPDPLAGGDARTGVARRLLAGARVARCVWPEMVCAPCRRGCARCCPVTWPRAILSGRARANSERARQTKYFLDLLGGVTKPGRVPAWRHLNAPRPRRDEPRPDPLDHGERNPGEDDETGRFSTSPGFAIGKASLH